MNYQRRSKGRITIVRRKDGSKKVAIDRHWSVNSDGTSKLGSAKNYVHRDGSSKLVYPHKYSPSYPMLGYMAARILR